MPGYVLGPKLLAISPPLWVGFDKQLPLNSTNFSIYRANEMNFGTQVLFGFGDSHLGLLISVSGVARGAVGAAAPSREP